MKIEYTLTKSEFIKAKLENKYKCKEFRRESFVSMYIINFILCAGSTIIIKQNINFFNNLYRNTFFIPNNR